MARTAQSPLARLMGKVTVKAETQCWEYGGCTNRDGYGMFKVDGQSVLAHRWLYSQAVGPLARGVEADHLCRNRRCCNPLHLEAVTPEENKLRITAPHRRSVTTMDHTLAVDLTEYL